MVGPERAVLTTDVFSRWVPPEPECLRMFVEQLAYLGWTAEQIGPWLLATVALFAAVIHTLSSASTAMP